jgi:hypothetical protein
MKEKESRKPSRFEENVFELRSHYLVFCCFFELFQTPPIKTILYFLVIALNGSNYSVFVVFRAFQTPPTYTNNLIFSCHILKWFAKTKKLTDIGILPVFVYTKEDA